MIQKATRNRIAFETLSNKKLQEESIAMEENIFYLQYFTFTKQFKDINLLVLQVEFQKGIIRADYAE